MVSYRSPCTFVHVRDNGINFAITERKGKRASAHSEKQTQ